MVQKKNTLRCLCEGAIMVALAQVLGYLKLYEMPQGGSVTLAMLPMMVFCCRWGAGPGFACCTLFGLLQLLLDGAYTWGWISIFFDYLIAFGLLGCAGFFRNAKQNLAVGSTVACLARFLSHFISGVLYVKGIADFDIYGVQTSSPYLYSAIYNAAYMIPNWLILFVCGLLLNRPLGKYLHGTKS